MNTVLAPRISVCITTYNMAPYIRQTLEGVFSQVCTVETEVIVVDDASTDGTQEILRESAEKLKGRLRIHLNDRNEGAMNALIRCTDLARAPYIAILDGDDFWIDDSKLQTQYDFLESHPDYCLTWHDAQVVDEHGQPSGLTFGERFRGRPYDGDFSFGDVLRWRVLGPTSSIVVLKSALHFPDWAPAFYGTEVMIFLLARKSGKLKYFPKILSAYRVRPRSRETAMGRKAKTLRNISDYKLLYTGFYPEERKFFESKLTWNYLYGSWLDLKGVRPFSFIKNVVMCFKFFVKLLRSVF